jgi:hypothetical protein
MSGELHPMGTRDGEAAEEGIPEGPSLEGNPEIEVSLLDPRRIPGRPSEECSLVDPVGPLRVEVHLVQDYDIGIHSSQDFGDALQTLEALLGRPALPVFENPLGAVTSAVSDIPCENAERVALEGCGYPGLRRLPDDETSTSGARALKAPPADGSRESDRQHEED